jgi:hypothetical protein
VNSRRGGYVSACVRRLLGVVVSSALLLAGCAGELTEEDKRAAAEYGSSGGHHASTTTSSPELPTRFYSWRELAATVGCEATLQGKAADFRQANCVIDGDTFVFLDFDTEKGQREWLELALIYGTIYLVGERWILSGRSKEYMEETLLPKLGGRIEYDPTHGAGG